MPWTQSTIKLIRLRSHTHSLTNGKHFGCLEKRSKNAFNYLHLNNSCQSNITWPLFCARGRTRPALNMTQRNRLSWIIHRYAMETDLEQTNTHPVKSALNDKQLLSTDSLWGMDRVDREQRCLHCPATPGVIQNDIGKQFPLIFQFPALYSAVQNSMTETVRLTH